MRARDVLRLCLSLFSFAPPFVLHSDKQSFERGEETIVISFFSSFFFFIINENYLVDK